MTDTTLIEQTLHLVAARAGDPTRLVFARLFAEHPHLELLFVRDPNWLVRGKMLWMTNENLLDFVTDKTYGAALIQVERVNHQGLGVDPTVFDTFYWTAVATSRNILGDAWTTEMDNPWTRTVADLTARA